MSRWSEFMSAASDETIQVYIRDHKKYKPEAVDAAIAELKKRGRPLSEEEVQSIRSTVQEVQVERRRDAEGYSENQTDDPNDPELYSSTAIYLMSFLFGATFTAVVYCMNLWRIKKSAWIAPVLIFSVGIVIFQVYALPGIVAGPILGGLVSLSFAHLLQGILWKHIAPVDLKFRKRSVLYPVIIGIVVSILFFVFVFNLHR